MKMFTKIFLASFLSLILGVDQAYAQEETVSVDTLITIDDAGNEIRKIIKKKTVRFEGKSNGKVGADKKVIRKKKMMFIGEGEGEKHEIILEQRDGDSEDTDIEIIMHNDGGSSIMGLDSDEPMIWINSDDEEFSFSSLDPVVFKKELRSKELARAIVQESEGDGKTRLIEELDALLSEIFDLKLEKMQNDIEKKAEMLEKERSKLEKRRLSKENMIKERKAKLMEKKEDKPQW